MPFTICYVWEDLDVPAKIGKEEKFGDHYSEANTLNQAFLETEAYVRSTLGRQKHKWDEGRIKLHKMWDVTEYAKLKGRFGKHKKVDDIIRPVIGHHVRADVHRIDADTLIARVNKELIKHHQPLPVAGLAAWQARAARNILDAFDNGRQTVLAELCARFGKTIWGGAVVRETNAPITIIVSYVLTSFSSFENDLTSFDQFKDLVLVDSADPDYQNIINTALANKKQVVVFLSMCAGEHRETKVDYLFNLPHDRLVIIDEADFGVHKPNQVTLLINARKKNDKVILMTGTNADKAASSWHIDHMLSVVYPELIMEKNSGQTTYNIPLQHFKVDPFRHTLVVDVEFYQADLSSVVESALKDDPELFGENGILLPSWTKTATNPVRAKGFLTRMLRAMFYGDGDSPELNMDEQFGIRPSKTGQRVSMMFIPHSTTNENLADIAAIATQTLGGYRVVPIYGEETSNREAEPDVKEAIEEAAKNNQHVLLISAKMAQRSFSVGQITELYLAYDAGDNGATIQKISRALTPHYAGKIGRIVSLSFDPNRDDKFDSLIIETAINYKKNQNLNSAKDALRDVLATVNIFRCAAGSAIRVEPNDYLEMAIERKSVGRVVGKVADFSPLSDNIIRAIANGKSDVIRAAIQQATPKGKTGLTVTKSTSSPKTQNITDDLLVKARKVITTIAENMDIIVYGTNAKTLHEAFDIVSKDATMCKAVREEFGLDFDLIKYLFDKKVINSDLIELQVDI
jgi:hypothetical protein